MSITSRINKVIIVYEVYQREYDNALLLKAYLEKLGFEVQIIYKLYLVGLKFSDEPKFVFVPNCYSDKDFDWYYYNLNGNNYYLIDLQYEQSLSNDEKNIEFHIPKGRAAEIIHLCWGNQYRQILINHNIEDKFAATVGALHLDFVRPEFNDYWYSRDFIAEKYGISKNKQWNLYFSSFALADNPLTKAALYEHLGAEYTDYFSDIATKSRNETIEWFKRLLAEHPDQIIIYRKHPTELLSENLQSLHQLYPEQFYLIDDYNIKQWIMIADLIITWYSTSVVECYAAKKSFHILRPYEIIDKYEVKMYVGGSFLKDYSSFEQAILKCDNTDYPIDVSGINEAYMFGEKTAVQSIGELLSAPIQYSYFETEDEFKHKRAMIVKSHHGFARYLIKRSYQKLYKMKILKIKSEKIRKRFAVDEWEMLSKVEDRHEQIEKINKIITRIMEGTDDV